MTETYNGDKLMALELKVTQLTQSVADFHATTDKTLAEIKNSVLRIETNINAKADRDDIEKVVSAISCKSDKVQTDDMVADIRQIRQNQWYLATGILIAFLTAVLTYIFKK